MTKTKEKLSRSEMGADSILEDISYMLDPDPEKLKVVRSILVEILDHAEDMGFWYEFKNTDPKRSKEKEYKEGREGWAQGFNKYQQAISRFDKHMAATRSYSLVNGRIP